MSTSIMLQNDAVVANVLNVITETQSTPVITNAQPSVDATLSQSTSSTSSTPIITNAQPRARQRESTPMPFRSRNQTLPLVEKDWFLGSSLFGMPSPEDDSLFIPPKDVNLSIGKISPKVLQSIQSRMCHDVRNAFNSHVEEYVAREFQGMV